VGFAPILLMTLALNNAAVRSPPVPYEGGREHFYEKYSPTGPQEYFFMKIYIQPYLLKAD
jgi:hypothetical protein